jgi:Mitochondrial carrier protein
MSVATSSAVASSSNSAAAEPQITDPKDAADDTPAEKTFFFLSPQVASYFVGTWCARWVQCCDSFKACSWWMRRGSLTDCSQSFGAVEDHPVRSHCFTPSDYWMDRPTPPPWNPPTCCRSSLLSTRSLTSRMLTCTSFRQVQPRGSSSEYKGVWRSLVRMWQEEGFRGFMRGNGINCIRIVPYRWVSRSFRFIKPSSSVRWTN